MFKCDSNIKNMNTDSYLIARNWYKWSKLWKVKRLTFFFEKSNCQPLIDFIFKCDLSSGKMNVDLDWEVKISQDRQNGKKLECWLLTWKSQSLTWFKCQIIILPLD